MNLGFSTRATLASIAGGIALSLLAGSIVAEPGTATALDVNVDDRSMSVASTNSTALESLTSGSVSRLSGSNRFATSAAISAASFSPGVPVVYIANGLNFPDALSGAPVAGKDSAPVLLTPAGTIPSVIRAELIRLNPENIVVFGGAGAISDSISNGLSEFLGTDIESSVLASTPVPTVTGVAQVGKELTASSGSWGPSPVSLAYQWFADGVAVSGATAVTFTPAADEVGKAATIQVTGSKAGYTSVTKTSTPVTILSAPIQWAIKSAPIITGDTFTGSLLTAVISPWVPQPTTLAFQWMSNGVAVTGATNAEYTVRAADGGAALTVEVTGSRDGYVDAMMTSAPFSIPAPPTFDWDAAELRVSLAFGASQSGALNFRTNVNSGLTFQVLGGLAGMIELNANSAIQSVNGYAITYTVDASAMTGQYSGTIVAQVDGNVIGEPLGYILDVSEIDDKLIPIGISNPSSTRIDTVQGTAVVRDRVTIEIGAQMERPRSEARRIAQELGATIEGNVGGTRLFDLRLPSADLTDIAALLTALRSDPAVSNATRSWLGSSDLVPNDPIWNQGNGDQHWNLDMINAQGAWNVASGSNTRAGVIDTGFAIGHPDLAPNVYAVSGTGNMPQHGTHTAGTVCAAGNNGVGMTGVAYNCNLLLRAISDGGTSASQMAESMRWMAGQGARVVNISYGYKTSFDCTKTPLTEEEASQYRELLDISAILREQAAQLSDILWVFSAGNDSWDASCNASGRLGDFPNIVSVAAVDRTGALASYSNFGRYVSVAAPGGSNNDGTQVFSAAPVFCPLGDGDRCTPEYAYMAGTSMAAPHVTGTAALAFSANPALTAAQAKSCLVSAAAAGGRAVQGQPFFVIDAKRTVDCAVSTGVEPPAAAVLLTWGQGPGGTIGSDIPRDVQGINPTSLIGHHAIAAADANGRLWTWGSGASGMLGNGGSLTTTSPARLELPTGVVDVKSANWTRYALTDAGFVYSWGAADYGLVGVPRASPTRPILIPTLSEVVALETSGLNAYALTSSGQVFAWGDGQNGNAGVGSTLTVNSPRLIAGLPKIVRVVPQRYAGFAIDTAGRLWSWGGSGRAEVLGRSGGAAPAIVPGLSNVVDVVGTNPRTSMTTFFALLADGTVWGWGDGDYGLLGTGNNVGSAQPIQLTGLSNTKQLAVGFRTAFAVDGDGVVRAWGFGSNGELGDGTTTWYTSTPQVVPGLPAARHVYSNGETEFVLDTGGGVWSWGQNIKGSLGNGTSIATAIPTPVIGVTGATKLFVTPYGGGVFALVPR